MHSHSLDITKNMWPREPQRYSAFSKKFVINMKLSLDQLPLKADKIARIQQVQFNVKRTRGLLNLK